MTKRKWHKSGLYIVNVAFVGGDKCSKIYITFRPLPQCIIRYGVGLRATDAESKWVVPTSASCRLQIEQHSLLWIWTAGSAWWGYTSSDDR